MTIDSCHCHLIWRTKWRTRMSIFSRSSKGLWDDLDDQSQQSSGPYSWSVSQSQHHVTTVGHIRW